MKKVSFLLSFRVLWLKKTGLIGTSFFTMPVGMSHKLLQHPIQETSDAKTKPRELTVSPFVKFQSPSLVCPLPSRFQSLLVCFILKNKEVGEITKMCLHNLVQNQKSPLFASPRPPQNCGHRKILTCIWDTPCFHWIELLSISAFLLANEGQKKCSPKSVLSTSQIP